MTLTVHNAEVRTATVEVKTLTISGKQVTQAVFRQLVEEPLISEAGNFRGLPWGTVNYHPGKCALTDRTYAGNRGHRHVVWQDGNDLRRACVGEPVERLSADEHWSDAADAWVDAAALEGWQPSDEWWSKQSILGFREPEVVIRGDDGWQGAANVSQAALSFWRLRDEPYKDSTDGWGKDENVRWHKERSDLIQRLTASSGGDSREVLMKEWRAEADEYDRLLHSIQSRWAEILALPQLFIAV